MPGQTKKTFYQIVNDKNFIVRDHRVHDVRTLPGVTLLDIIYRLSAAYLETQAIELRRIVFKQPVVTSESFDSRVSVTFVPEKSHWRVAVTSKKIKNNIPVGSLPDENMECLLFPRNSSDAGRSMNVKDIIENHTRKWEMDDIYALARKVRIQHYEFMKTLGTVYQKNQEEIMQLHLSNLAEKYRDKFYAHPAFLDASTFAGATFRMDGTQFRDHTPYIPFMIERFCIYRPLPATIYTYTQNTGSGTGNSSEPPDILSTDITILNEAGTVLVEFEKLTVKRIREPQLIQKLVETEHSQTRKAAVPEHSTPAPGYQPAKDTGESRKAIPFAGDPKQLLISYLQKEIGSILDQPPARIEPDCGFYDLGLDSTNLLGLVKKLEHKFRRQFYPTLLFEYSNIRRLAEYLLENGGDLSALTGTWTEPRQTEPDSSVTQVDSKHQLLYLQPIWWQQNPPRRSGRPIYNQRLILLDDPAEALPVEIKPCVNHMSDEVRVVELDSGTEDIPSRVETKFKKVLAILKEQLRSKTNGELLVQVIGDAGPDGRYINALGGLFKSAFKETPRVNSQIITIEQFHAQPAERIAHLLEEEALTAEKGAAEICYRGEGLRRYTRKWQRTAPEPAQCTCFKEGGVYVITGGMGGLGCILAEHIASRAGVKLALIGRSGLTKAKEEKIDELRQKGAEVLYVHADLGDSGELAKALADIRHAFGVINGILHCAGAVYDQFIINKNPEEIKTVFRPKVRGLWNLNMLTREDSLDFMVLFSSTAAVLGNLGQADYAGANAFMDIFAANREEMVQQGLCHGKTFTINWPLWADGGMKVDSELEQMMYSASGLKSLAAREGMAALENILCQPQTQTMVLYGAGSRINDFVSSFLLPVPEFKEDPVPLSQRATGFSQYSQDDIAIIGLAGRYPMAENIEQFYQNLREGKNCISGIPKERWKDYDFTLDVEQFYHYGGFIDGIDEFDPLFFNISPRQAEMMDPQARLFLEIAWAACEDAGFYQNRTEHYYPSLSDQSVGVFAGVFWSHYELFAEDMTQKYGTPVAFGISPASISNMVSYCLNFHGPSVAVDTMCSSALTAIHLACESIRKHECEYAIAGGVNLVTHPHKYMFLKQAQFLASDGLCHSFGADGDGYVPGEGVGAVMLTTLRRAEQEGYPIYAVIKGSAMNHGGKTSGFSVPDPVAQAEVITQALNHSGINPRTVSYVEAHGTGTSLGDPIEIRGLTKAYGHFTNDQQFCAIGSSKSNIGHLEAAAGIASLTKLLLQFKHGEIFPSLHTEKLNPNIPFNETPFYVARDLTRWQPTELTVDGEKVTLPRRAGLSSFGAGGSNVHMILEEYQAPVSAPEKPREPEIFIISARNEDRLREKARQLEDYLISIGSRAQFGNLAYTLQVGREAMEARLAIVARSLEDLREKLGDFLACKTNIAGAFWSDPSQMANPPLLLKQEQEDMEYLSALVNKGDLEKIAALWAFGSCISWEQLFRGRKRSRLSLPTYPFAKERYWLPEVPDQARTRGGIPGLHPLIDYNSSTFEEQSFVKVLTGSEYFLKDHSIDGKSVLPGVIYLEMARAAGELANCGNPVKVLKNILWATPVVMGATPREVSISLYPNGGAADFEIVTKGPDNSRTIHAQGRIGYGDGKACSETTDLDIEAIKQRCRHNMSRRDLYREFEDHRFKYGRGFQAVHEIWYSETEALSSIEFPEELTESFSACNWHPSMIDGAFQTVSRLIPKSTGGEGVYLPYALAELTFIQPLSKKCYAFAEPAPVRGENSGIIKYNIILTDTQGRVLVRMREFTVKALSTQSISGGNVSRVYYKPEWVEWEAKPGTRLDSETIILFDLNEELKGILREHAAGVILVKPGKEYRCIGEGTYEIDPHSRKDFVRLLENLHLKHWESCRIVYHWPQGNFSGTEAEMHRELDMGIYGLSNLTQALMEQKSAEKIRVLYVYESSGAGKPHQGAVSGFAKTLRRENHRFLYKVLDLRREQPGLPEELARIILAELEAGDDGVEIRYVQGVRYAKHLAEMRMETENHRSLPIKKQGVYLITGGAGGLGFIFATYLAEKFKANLVLTGRSRLSREKALKLKELEGLGAQVIYLPADVTNQGEVAKLVQSIKARFGCLNGVIHSAGVIRDSFLLKKSRTEMEEVLGPKVFGTKYLDEATAHEKLDFFVLFSSIAAELGNLGQSDYAFGNSYMDYFARWREAKGRPGKSLSINWPLWRDGGMQAGEDLIVQMEESVGLIPLSAEAGIAAFEAGLRRTDSQIMILEGNAARIKAFVQGEASLDATANETLENDAQPGGSESEDTGLRAETEEFLKGILGREIKLPVEKINSREPLEKYGIDSVMVMNLTRELERDFGELSKTLFFEYQTIAELAGYFMEGFPQVLREKLGGRPKTPPKSAAVLNDGSAGIIRRSRFASQSRNEAAVITEDIAIIGVSGRYPMARNLDEFWDNLKSGKDCITEIPKQRWDWRDYPDSCKWGGFIDDVDKFDPLFFNIPPRDAYLIDPQERLFLETVWHTLEDAGYTRTGLWNKKVGVFVGVMYGQYQLFGAEESLKGHIMASSSIHASVANRVSYYFNFHGPSIALDTMCSSSLTAIHLACESIRRGESEVAVAGGVNVTIHPDKYISLNQGNFTSSDGRCRSFGEGGDGYVPGEGVGAIFLKPLSRAIADSDRIYAVIKASSVNHGGKTNGYTVPNPNSQAELIAETLRKTGIDPRTVSYIEAHGTGTSLGDPIEITGLMKAFGESSHAGQYCSIGSVKSNIGHLESAAGIAGITKILLQLKNKQLVPSLHSQPLNPHIHFKDSPFYVQQELAKWVRPVVDTGGMKQEYPRRAGISAFGAGGANAHIILEEYDTPQRVSESDPEEQIFVFSARNPDRLRESARQMVEFLRRTAAPKSTETLIPDVWPDRVREDVVRIASELLRISQDKLPVTDEMTKIGLDQAGLENLTERINDYFNLEISAALLSESRSLDAVSQYMIQTFPEPLKRFYGSETPVPEIREDVKAPSLAEIAYTLQAAREPMEERLVIIATSSEELTRRLTEYCRGNSEVSDLYSGNINSSGLNTDLLMGGREGQEFLRIIIDDRQLKKLAQLWIGGVEVDWKLLYPHGVPQRISLPVYPFAAERYWITKSASSRKLTTGSGIAARLHPLIDSNISNMDGLCFTKTIHLAEFFMDDYRLGSGRYLPGVLYPEMARAAGNFANSHAQVQKLAQIKLGLPVLLAEAQVLEIRLYPGDSTVQWEISTVMKDGGKAISAQGQLMYQEGLGSGEKTDWDDVPIKAIQTRCHNRIIGQEFYRDIAACGLEYGSSFSGAQEIFSQDGEALVKFQCPAEQRNDSDCYILHPSWLETVLQTITWLMFEHDRIPKIYLLCSIAEIKFYGRPPDHGCVYVTRSKAGGRQFDAVLTAEDGRRIIQIRGLDVSEFENSHNPQPDELMQVKKLLQRLEAGELDVDLVDETIIQNLNLESS